MRSQKGIFFRGISVHRGTALAAGACILLAAGCGGGGGGVTVVAGPPATPANVTAVSDAPNRRVVMKWDISSGATSYKIFRDPPVPATPALTKTRAGLAGRALIGSSAQGEYDDKAVQDGVTYTYQVAASNGPADSAESAGVPVTYRAAAGITINPAQPSLLLGATTTFTAAVTGLSGSDVTWSVQEGPQGGTITAGGQYTAPMIVGTYHIVAVSQADPTKQAVATVLVGTSNGSTTVTVQ